MHPKLCPFSVGEYFLFFLLARKPFHYWFTPEPRTALEENKVILIRSDLIHKTGVQCNINVIKFNLYNNFILIQSDLIHKTGVQCNIMSLNLIYTTTLY